jgi:hypothetical protein
MTLVSLDSDKMYIETHPSRGNTGVVHPTSPAAPKLDYRERAACEIDRSESGRPFRNISVPVGRNWNALDFAFPANMNGWEKLRINDDTQKIGEISNTGLQIRDCVPSNDGLRVERTVVMKKRAGGLNLRAFGRIMLRFADRLGMVAGSKENKP